MEKLFKKAATLLHLRCLRYVAYNDGRYVTSTSCSVATSKQRSFGMFVSTVGEGKGSAYTHILPVRHAGRYSFPNSSILPLQPICANMSRFCACQAIDSRQYCKCDKALLLK